MARIEKTVFLSYRRTNAAWALAIYQNLTQHGYDVFIDYLSIAAGSFESVILENVRARAHFLIVLTPSALERCSRPGDWLRREIETALDEKRNIIPLMLESFDFNTPAIADQLTGKLSLLREYQAVGVPVEYFFQAMEKLRSQNLNVALDAVSHPASPPAQEAAKEQQVAAGTAPAVQDEELTALTYFERGFSATDLDEQIRFYTEAIRLMPDFVGAYGNRGIARGEKGDLEGALGDFDEAIRLEPDAKVYYNRGVARSEKGDLDGALADYDEAIRLDPDDVDFYYNRGTVRSEKGDLEGALADYNETVRLKPDDASAHVGRGNARKAKGDVAGALADYSEAIRLNPNDASAFYNRGDAPRANGDLKGALADLERYLELGGGERHHQAAAEKATRDLKSKL